jgi:predicted TIM-barrel fold metal-dependent hydrolase
LQEQSVIVDIHSHIWQDQLPRLPSYFEALRKNGVEKSVVQVLESWGREVAPGVKWRGAGNDYVAKCVGEYPDRLIMFGTLPPQLDDSPEQLEELVKQYPTMKGLKLHPAIQGFDPANPRVIRFVRKAADLGLPMLIHTGEVGWVGRLAFNDPCRLDDLAMSVPEATIIVAHGASTPIVPWIVKRHPNMVMDTAYAPNWPSLPPSRWKFQAVDEDVVSFLGAERILYGTDINPAITVHPTQVRDVDFQDLADVQAIVAAGIKVIEDLKISDREKRLILAENAQSLLGL